MLRWWVRSCTLALLSTAGVLVHGCYRAEIDLRALDDAGPGGSNGAGSGSGGANEKPDGAPLLPWLGRACKSNDECGGTGLRCVSALEDYLSGRGSPAAGLCTADCSQDADCHGFDSSAVCVTLGEAPLIKQYATTPVARLCMLGCSLGAPAGDTKCHARPELACRPFAPNQAASCEQGETCPDGTFCFRGVCREAACGPRCNSDADCKGQRFCHPFTGLCVVEQPVSPPIGADCEDDASVCGDGNCLDVSADAKHQKSMCTQSCTIGSVCGNGTGACTAPRLDNWIAGDAGYCEQLCDCDEDCRHPADRCLAWPLISMATHFGSNGVCGVPRDDQPSLACPDARR
jgi:hypothetical protein